MADLSNFLEDALVNAALRNTPYASPAVVYIALFTAVTNAEAGTGTEVSGGSYARQPVTFSAPVNGVTSNSAMVVFPTATTDWGTITHAGIFDDLSAGNALTVLKALSSPKQVNTGDTLRFLATNLTFSLA